MRHPFFVCAGLLWAVAPLRAESPAPEAPFTASWDSLGKYTCPEWFRDAKFGIWSHWGPQAVPGCGDWYARELFVQGSVANRDFLKHRGHPSEKGMEVIFPEWTAAKFDPEKLMALYKRAGARYFVSMAVHHDNFDLWDSAHHRWNAVRMGPRRDIVAAWAAAARGQGLRFGVSEHLAASFWFYQAAHGADKTGPLAGVPYVGTRPELRDLYHAKAPASDTISGTGASEGAKTVAGQYWYTTDAAFAKHWEDRMTDLLDKCQPDLLYSDGGVPFGVRGRSIMAKLYNDSARRHGGRNEAVYNCKDKADAVHHQHPGYEDYREGTCVGDLERGLMPGIRANPWQTDTSIGDWFYNPRWRCQRSDGSSGNYRDVGWVVRTLADVVSKNGNMLLNVVQRADGSLDPEAEQLCVQLGDWMAVHGEAIHGTRPWKVHGEGLRVKGAHYREDFGFGPTDIRYTTKPGVLYAIVLGDPKDDRVVAKHLAAAAGKVTRVELLGTDEAPAWKQTGEALEVTLPKTGRNAVALVLRITGEGLVPAAR